MPFGVLKIIVRPSGENALSWKYSVDPPASSLRRTMRWPVSASIHAAGPSCTRRSRMAAASVAATSTVLMAPILYPPARRFSERNLAACGAAL